MGRPKCHLFLSCAIAIFGAGAVSAATISLDDAGTDPILTSPYFSFGVDEVGNFMGQFTNLSEPPMDFTFLELTATFTPAFWFGPTGPPTIGAFCDGMNAFNSCSVSVQSSIFTLVFTFTGLDDTHHGIPFDHILGITASNFQPEQVIIAAATPVPAPEPAAFGLAGIGILLLLVGVRRQQLLKFRVRA
jgi:hypothetical protein